MVLTVRIGAGTQIIPSYLPGGANVHPIAKRTLDRFIAFCTTSARNRRTVGRRTGIIAAVHRTLRRPTRDKSRATDSWK